jgi:hypothetical protein
LDLGDLVEETCFFATISEEGALNSMEEDALNSMEEGALNSMEEDADSFKHKI